MPLESLQSLSGRLRHGDVTLVDYLTDLETRFDTIEPRLRAFVPENGRFNRLRREAAELAARYPDPDNRPPLYGVPIGVKDIFHVEGMITRAGTTLPPELLQGPESAAVSALKQAGALILGKTVTTEFAYFAPGPTRHPLSDTLGEERTPGGSSSGSAAAVAAGLCTLALGTQTIGSISRPASFCGIVGFKPSFGRIPTRGVLPLSESADTVGFFVPAAADIALAAAVLVEGLKTVEPVNTKPVLGVPVGPYLDRVPTETLDHLGLVLDRLAAAGCTIREVPALPNFDDIYRRHNQLVAAEAGAVHADWYTDYPDRYHPKTTELITRGQSVSAVDYRAALNSRFVVREALQSLMDEQGIDAWLSPAALGPAPRGLNSTGDPVMNLPWTHAGLPTVALPSGKDSGGWPLGIQLAGRFGADELVVAITERLAGIVTG